MQWDRIFLRTWMACYTLIFLTYWDYIHLDTLLSLQTPKTRFPDEKIFIVYHQITELYFSLILWEIDQIAGADTLEESFFVARIQRINQYFKQLRDSFSIMVQGMEKDQFLKFRMSLLPASGFQSSQYRLIEIYSTDMINLVNSAEREALTEYSDIGQQLEKLYWRKWCDRTCLGQTNIDTATIRREVHAGLQGCGDEIQGQESPETLLKKFPAIQTVIQCLRELDTLSNVQWPLAHLRAAGHYLHKKPQGH